MARMILWLKIFFMRMNMIGCLMEIMTISTLQAEQKSKEKQSTNKRQNISKKGKVQKEMENLQKDKEEIQKRKAEKGKAEGFQNRKALKLDGVS